MLTLDCQHHYCLTCFSNLVAFAMENETHFPPKCCLLEIPRSMILDNLGHSRRKDYKTKMEEYSIPRPERLYCPSPACGRWIPPKVTKKRPRSRKCPSCGTRMCCTCRGYAHDSADVSCPRYSWAGTVIRPNSINWRKCSGCGALVGTSSQHIICDCRAQTQFWYIIHVTLAPTTHSGENDSN